MADEKLKSYNKGIQDLFGTNEKTEKVIDNLDFNTDLFYGARGIIRNTTNEDKNSYNLAVRYIHRYLEYIAKQNTINKHFQELHTIIFNLSDINYNKQENELAEKAVDILIEKKAVESLKEKINKLDEEVKKQQLNKLQQYINKPLNLNRDMTEIVLGLNNDNLHMYNPEKVKSITNVKSNDKQPYSPIKVQSTPPIQIPQKTPQQSKRIMVPLLKTVTSEKSDDKQSNHKQLNFIIFGIILMILIVFLIFKNR